MRPGHPTLYEVNTRLWLARLSERIGRPATLADVPDEELADMARRGFDWLWCMGVWQTGPAGREEALAAHMLPGYRETLDDFGEADVTSSPYAVRRYTVHEDFGGDEALAGLRERLARHDIGLVLDFVPNHTARDHRWAAEHPEYYIAAGGEPSAGRSMRVETRRGPRVLAHGSDHTYRWTDTLQLNYRHAGLRRAMADELLAVAARCDGVRCDMAMLLVPEIMQRWGEASLPSDGSEPVDLPFWDEAIAGVRRAHPGFVFIAEAYWDLEWRLQRWGFDYTYDKTLYDRLTHGEAESVRGHLRADAEYQRRSVRFLENHDEPRIAAVLDPPRHRAAALVAFLVPGMRFFHDGQLEGHVCRVPIQLRRGPAEDTDGELADFYARLLALLGSPELRTGEWSLLEVAPAWDGNATWRQFVAFTWRGSDGGRLMVVVNYAGARGQCRVAVPFPEIAGGAVRLEELLGTDSYDRYGDEMLSRGLYVELPSWGAHVFDVRMA